MKKKICRIGSTERLKAQKGFAGTFRRDASSVVQCSAPVLRICAASIAVDWDISPGRYHDDMFIA
jgi:hypothetical protein